MPGYGQIGHIGFAGESTWGTPVAVGSGDFLEALSESVTMEIERFDVKNIVGRYAEPDDVAGLRRIAGEITVPAHPLQLGYFLRGAFGKQAVATTVLSGFLWNDQFLPATAEDGTNNPLPPWTLEIFRDVTSAHRYAGVQFGKLTLAVEPNQDLRVTAGLLAKTTSVIAKSTPTYPGTGPSPFTWDTTSVQVGGAAVDYVEALSVDFDNQVEGIPVLNNATEIARVRRSGPQLVRVSGTLGFENLTEYNRFLNQTEVELIATWTKADSFALLVRVPRLVYTAFPLGLSGRERMTVGFEGLGRYKVASSYAIEAVLTTIRSFF